MTWYDDYISPYSAALFTAVQITAETIAKAGASTVEISSKLANAISVFSDDIPTTTKLLYEYVHYQRTMTDSAASIHPNPRTDKEKEALDLFKRASNLTPEEAFRYDHLLNELNDIHIKKWASIYLKCNAYVEKFKDQLSASSDVSRIITAIHAELDREKIEPLLSYQIEEMVKSKLILLTMDKTSATKKHIAYLVAAHKEGNRLQTKAEGFTGEDFLREKIKQLEFLYKDIKNYEWTLSFVDDEPQTELNQGKRSIDLMRKMITEDAFFEKYKGRINLLDYDKDLKEERNDYNDKEKSTMQANEFAKASVKGGAIQTGMRYLSQVIEGKSYQTRKADVVLWSDCDLSVNLGGTAVLLASLFDKREASFSLGSRLHNDAHVIGKPDHRHMQSFLFNTLVNYMLNVNITDTLIGAKAITSDAVKQIHKGFNELSMAFDAEIYKLLREKDLSIIENPIVWIDSDLESQSEGLGPEIFQGLLRIITNFYPKLQTALSIGTEDESTTAGDPKKAMLIQCDILSQPQYSKQLAALIKLSQNNYFNFILNHIDGVYEKLLPQAFRDFVHNLRRFLIEIENGEVCLEAIKAMVNDIRQLTNNVDSRISLSFINHLFPEIRDVIELVFKEPQSLPLIIPLLLGHNVFTNAINDMGYLRLGEYKPENYQSMTPNTLLSLWIENGIQKKTTLAIEEKVLSEKEKHTLATRVEEGRRKLQALEVNKMSTPVVNVGISMMFNSAKTSNEYLDNVVREKIKRLIEISKDTHVKWTLIILDAIPASKRDPIECERIENYIHDLKNEFKHTCVEVAMHRAPEHAEKAKAVEHGMSLAASAGCDFVGYVDFSAKIDIGEMTQLVSHLIEEKQAGRSQSIAIGSRRNEASAVVNKPLIMILRSMWLNLMVKSMFPKLSHLGDTQTGFKLFSKEAWVAIKDQDLFCDSLSFDIELLQVASQLDIPITEFPVSFVDNKQNSNPAVNAEDVQSMFSDVIRIRARHADTPLFPPKKDEARFLAAGAEHMVYMLNGSIIKVPHEVIFPEFIGILKELIFKDKKGLALDKQEERLLDSGWMQRILNDKRLGKYIPDLRKWREFNAFIMQVISSNEKKEYKSMGYHCAESLGKDLVIPFKFVNTTFSCDIEGVKRVFGHQDRVKESAIATAVFSSRVKDILAGDKEGIQKTTEINALIAAGLDLFDKLWARGLFDLDMNFLSDTGFYPDSHGQEQLMTLDPGELITDICQINVANHIKQIENRSDYIELKLMLKNAGLSPVLIEAVLLNYQTKMNVFFEKVRKEQTLALHGKVGMGRGVSKHIDFAKDQRNEEDGSNDFRVAFKGQAFTKAADEMADAKKRMAPYENIKAQRQEPYLSKHAKPEPLPLQAEIARFTHVIPIAYRDKQSAHPSENVVHALPGSIHPTLTAIESAQKWAKDKAHLLVLNAGKGTRASILKVSQRGPTKGEITVKGKALYLHVAESMTPLKQALNTLDDETVIMCSADDWLQPSTRDIEKIADYFKQEPSPGMYWCDLPDAGKHIFPQTIEQNLLFISSPQSLDFIKTFCQKIPFIRGHEALRAQVETAILKMLEAEVIHASPSQRTTHASMSSSDTIAGLAQTIAPYYRAWAMSQGQRFYGGTKTPFLLVFKKSFIDEFKENIIATGLLRADNAQDITWEAILVNGMKCDLAVWQSYKPPLMQDLEGSERWNILWHEIQSLKEKHHINTDSDTQNKARVYEGHWANFDDPLALYQYMCTTDNVTVKTTDAGTKIISDTALTVDIVLKESNPLITDKTLVLVDSHVASSLNIQFMHQANQKIPTENRALFYQVQTSHLAGIKQLEVQHNDLVVGGKDNTLYAITMGPLLKQDLMQSPVFTFNETGARVPTGKSYSEFMKTNNSLSMQPSSLSFFFDKKRQPAGRDANLVPKSTQLVEASTLPSN